MEVTKYSDGTVAYQTSSHLQPKARAIEAMRADMNTLLAMMKHPPLKEGEGVVKRQKPEAGPFIGGRGAEYTLTVTRTED